MKLQDLLCAFTSLGLKDLQLPKPYKYCGRVNKNAQKRAWRLKEGTKRFIFVSKKAWDKNSSTAVGQLPGRPAPWSTSVFVWSMASLVDGGAGGLEFRDVLGCLFSDFTSCRQHANQILVDVMFRQFTCTLGCFLVGQRRLQYVFPVAFDGLTQLWCQVQGGSVTSKATLQKEHRRSAKSPKNSARPQNDGKSWTGTYDFCWNKEPQQVLERGFNT